MPARRHHPTRGYSTLPALQKCAQFENSGTTSAAGDRGTRIHASVEQWLTGQQVEGAFTDKEMAEEEVTDELIWIHNAVANLFPTGKVEAEIEVPLLDSDFREVTFGTADYYATGHLADLKTGRKSDYRAQMAGLALALMDRDGIDSMKVSLIWSMSREVETWTWSRAAVEAIVWPIFEAQDRGDPAVVNSKCVYCKKKGTCPARLTTVNTLPTGLSKAASIEAYVAQATPAERGDLLRKIDQARKWCDDAKGAVESWALAHPDQAIEGFKVGLTSPKRVWMDEVLATEALQSYAYEKGKDPDLLVESKLVGVTKVHEILGKSKSVKELVDKLLVQPEGKPALLIDWTAGKAEA